MEAARRVIPEVLGELAELTGRSYPVMDTYRMEDAEAALVLINSAAETAKDVADSLRSQGHKVGVVSPNVLRPFPAQEVRAAVLGALQPLTRLTRSGPTRSELLIRQLVVHSPGHEVRAHEPFTRFWSPRRTQ